MSRNAVLILLLMSLGAAVLWSWGGAVSIVLGGVLALLNLKWLSRAVDGILGIELESKRGMNIGHFLMGYLGRLVLILVCLFAIVYFSFLSLLGALMGLSVFVLAGFLEAFLLVVRRRGTS